MCPKRNSRAGPIIGLRVLDLADEKADFCSKLLADLGAEVFRVELQAGSTFERASSFRKDGLDHEKYLSYFYRNNDKIILPLDPNLPDDRGTLNNLIKKTDVIVESFAPGHLDKLGMGYRALSAENPGLIMASVTGFGQTGPFRDFPSCDLVAAATGGQMYVCGAPGQPPLKLFGGQSYLIASLFAAVGVLLALRGKRIDGYGRHIDISLQESVLATLDHVMPRFFRDAVTARRQGGRHWNDLFEILPCKDGFIHLTPFLRWESLVDWLDGEGMAEDLHEAPWKEEAYRTARVDHVVAVLEKWTRMHTAHELFHLGQLMGFPWAPVHTPADVRACPQLKERRFFRSFEPEGEGHSISLPGMPYRFVPSFDPPAQPEPHSERAPAGRRPGAPVSKEKKSTDAAFQPDPPHRNPGVLDGIRVLDFTRVLAGPFATRMLGDFGAEVIKVQSMKNTVGVEDNRQAYFGTWNRNKLGITLDMDRLEGRELALKLVEISDVVVENFSPRVMTNWGLDYEALRSVKKDIIMARMSAMGQTGPWKDYTAFAPTIHSLSGHSYLTAYPKDTPMGPGFSYADVVAGLYCALAVSAAMDYRHSTGRGLMIDLSEYEAACTMLGPALMEAAADSSDNLSWGNRSGCDTAAPCNCYPCPEEDRWCVIAVFNDAQWEKLCHVMGSPTWSLDPKFSEFSERKAHEAELDEHLAKWTAGHSAPEIVRLLQQAGVPAGIVATARDLAEDPQLAARDCFMGIGHPVSGGIPIERCPIRFMDDAQGPLHPSPLLGEHNAHVYKKLLGLSDEKYDYYIRERIIS